MNSPKPQNNYKPGSIRDDCQTPPEAVELLIPWLRRAGIETIWEPAVGKRLLAFALRRYGFTVIETDIKTKHDFLTGSVPDGTQVIVTNPPFSMATEFTQRCQEIGLPWALLMKDDVASSEKFRQAVWLGDSDWKYAYPTYQVIVPSRRICFKMPNKGWFTDRKDKRGDIAGFKNNSSQFHTNWYTSGLNLPHHTIRMEYQQVDRYKLALELGGAIKSDWGEDRIYVEPFTCDYTEEELNRIIDRGIIDSSKIL